MVSRSLETAATQRFLMEQLAIPLSQQAGKWLVIPQTAGCAITSDLASVVCSPSRMASSYISNAPARGRPMGAPLLCRDPFALSEVHPRNGNNKELWDE